MFTHHTSGSANVSNGTINVAMMAASTTRRPAHRIRDRANAAMLLIRMPRATVTAETQHRVDQEPRRRHPVEHPAVVVQRQLPDRQDRPTEERSAKICASGLNDEITMNTIGNAKHHDQQLVPSRACRRCVTVLMSALLPGQESLDGGHRQHQHEEDE